MTELRLSDADRERLGVAEWLDYDMTNLSMVEAETLQEQFGVEPEDRLDWFRGQPVLKDGEPVLDEDDEPVRKRSMKVYRFIVWCALRRAGVKADPLEFDFDYSGVRFRREDPKDSSTPTEASDT